VQQPPQPASISAQGWRLHPIGCARQPRPGFG
jgi:hypothetical protein